MTIQEAIKSGKPYKRKLDKIWNTAYDIKTYSVESILADDWEIKQEPREWTIKVCQSGQICSKESMSCSRIGAAKMIKVREVIE